jgi:penicillin-binding protein 1C
MKLLRIGAAAGSAIVLSMTLAFGIWLAALDPLPTGIAVSQTVVDRQGRLLRPYALRDGRWRLPVSVEDVDSRYIDVLLAYEDRRFRAHPGIDPFALGRAALQWITRGHIISGGSTITMQVARLMEPRRSRSVSTKMRQMARALQLEWRYSKDEILCLYLSLAPFGGNLEGVRAASLSYFGKEPRRLTLGEAALLAALPQSPERRRPDRRHEGAQTARDRVLDRLASAGVLPADEVAHAKQEPLAHARLAMPALAPHAADQVVAAEPSSSLHRLTIDAPLQKLLENLVRERARTLGPGISAAILAVDHQTGEVRARVASADYFDDRRAGQVDMTKALRSPGSTLKPFIYGFAFEDGLIHPETLIDDRPVRYGSYAPENFDLTFQGTVTVRRALQMSLNVPAIAVLDRLGVARLSTRLMQAGAALTLPKGEAPGLAMGLGGVGIRLDQLTMLYAAVARGGDALLLKESEAEPAGTARRLMDRTAAWYLGNVLIGAPPPENAPHGRIAFKTGTSYGYRDAWALGFDGRTTIGVWVGRPDGAPVPGLVGRTSAAPILFDAFARSGKYSPLPRPPNGALIAATDRLPPPLQRFRSAAQLGGRSDPPKIMFPPDGARLAQGTGDDEPIALKFAGGVQPLTVLVNGAPLDVPAGRRTVFFRPDGAGFARLTVMDARGSTDSVVVRVR